MNTEINCHFCTHFNKDGYCEVLGLKPCYPQNGCDYFSKRVKNEYERGWNDALSKALDEAYTIHSEEGIFKVVQAETLIGLGYAIDEPHLEQESVPEIKTVTNAKEAEVYPISENITKGFEEFTKMIFKQGQAESKTENEHKECEVKVITHGNCMICRKENEEEGEE